LSKRIAITAQGTRVVVPWMPHNALKGAWMKTKLPKSRGL